MKRSCQIPCERVEVQRRRIEAGIAGRRRVTGRPNTGNSQTQAAEASPEIELEQIYAILAERYPVYFQGPTSDGTKSFEFTTATDYRFWATTQNYAIVDRGTIIVYGNGTDHAVVVLGQVTALVPPGR
jgi:hypothetical protein